MPNLCALQGWKLKPMSTLREWLAALPKAELHVHLEGAIPIAALWRLIEKYGGDPDVACEADLRRRLSYRDFADFIDAWIWKNGFLRELEDFEHFAWAMADGFRRQNIRYAEVFFSPSCFGELGLIPQDLAAAIRRGLDRVPETEVWLVADLVREHGPARAAETLAQIAEARSCGVIGIGIGGAEQRYPPAPFAAVYAAARRLGLRTSAHAGEAAGAASVRAAIDHLAVDRIGHATRAEEDPALLDLLAARQIPLEICPLSNLATGVVRDIADHPVRRFWQHGMKLTINTDDPGMFHNSLVEEFVLLHDRFGFSRGDIRALILNALDAAWQPEARKAELSAAFAADPAWAAVPEPAADR